MNGLCECGCGQQPEIAKITRTHLRHVKGQPKPYVKGHHNHQRANRDNYAVDPETGCWNWQGVVNNWGYGVIRVESRTRPAHRYHYEQRHGPVSDDLQIDHLCRNRRCVNPDHLEAVTQATNRRRGKHIRLSIEIAREIRRLHAAGRTANSLAREFGISSSTAHYIVTNQQWKEDERDLAA